MPGACATACCRGCGEHLSPHPVDPTAQRAASVTDERLYRESLSSKWTEGLFVTLTLVFGALSIWRAGTFGADFWAAALFGVSALFLFYSVNYRTLVIRLTPKSLRLKFGLFAWVVPVDNIEACQLDDLPPWLRYGGAGIHFMIVRGRYRASLNFLEHPRVVIALRRRAGPVRDISFSTRQPEALLRLIRAAVWAPEATPPVAPLPAPGVTADD